MRCLSVVLLALGACTSAVKSEGFRGSISNAHDRALNGRVDVSGAPSCGTVGPDGRELRLVGPDFQLTLAEPPGREDRRRVDLDVRGERYTTDRPGGRSDLVLETPGGRLIGSLSARLVHESAGSMVDGRPAPVRELDLELTFNLQPCL